MPGSRRWSSTVVMFGLMYLNTYQADHVFFSQTRAWMAVLMGATMAEMKALIADLEDHAPARGAR